jgi:hypothetical protein
VKALRALILTTLALMTASPSSAEQPIKMYFHQLKWRLDFSDDKPYNHLAKEVLKGIEDRFDIQISPLSRSEKDWLSGQRACSYPSNIRAVERFDPEAKLIASIPLDVVSVRAYMPPGAPEITSLADLEQKQVAFVRGSVAETLLEPVNVDPMTVASDEQLIGMLRRGRLDAFLGYHPDTAIALDEYGGAEFLQASSFSPPKMRFPVGVVCYHFDGVEPLIRRINQNTCNLHRTGRIREILGPHAEMPSDAELGEWVERAIGGESAMN